MIFARHAHHGFAIVHARAKVLGLPEQERLCCSDPCRGVYRIPLAALARMLCPHDGCTSVYVIICVVVVVLINKQLKS